MRIELTWVLDLDFKMLEFQDQDQQVNVILMKGHFNFDRHAFEIERN